ncbi:Chorismate synthase, partial [gut metagenome]
MEERADCLSIVPGVIPMSQKQLVRTTDHALMNTFGNLFRLTTFGESHGPGVGGVIDGFPAGIAIDMDFLQSELNRRRPGQSQLTTPRKEADRVEILSGVFEGFS